jgi:Domain of unknown function (DUF4105)
MTNRAGRGARAASRPRRCAAPVLAVAMLVAARDAGASPPTIPRGRPQVAGTEQGAARPEARQPARPARPVSEDAAYVESLVRRARARGLASSAIWLRLGHWRASFWHHGHRSEVDGAPMFLAASGARDPAAELDATLRGFFAPRTANPDRHPVCRFPARLSWLHQQLGLDLARIQVQDCPGLRRFIELLRPRAITLVFSSYYLARAASAFGHTFLRVEKASQLATEERRQLLDMGIDYGATVDTENVLLYALRGLTGMFRGHFKRLPYYYKVREYNDYESRDLWEYELELTPDQVMMVVAHIWELGHSWFDYYYLTENCSYHILGVLEVADPKIRLLDHISNPVIPSETVKALYRNRGLVRRVTYRPSLETQFKARVRGLSRAQLAAVERLAADPDASLDGLSRRQRIASLDAAADLNDMRHADDIVFQPRSEGARRKQRLLERRSAIHLPSAELAVDPPWHKAPHVSHGSRRIGFGVGSSSDRDVYGRLTFRLALHDMADPPAGYPDLIAFEFLPTALRFPSTGDAPVTLEELYLLRIRHLNEWTRFNRRPSWNMRAGVRRLTEDECSGCMMGEVAGGGGWGKTFFSGRLNFLATLDTMAGWGPRVVGLDDSGFRLGLGPTASLRAVLASRTVFLLAGDWFWLPEQERDSIWSASATLRTGIGDRSAVDLELVARPGEPSAHLSWLLYY